MPCKSFIKQNRHFQNLTCNYTLEEKKKKNLVFKGQEIYYIYGKSLPAGLSSTWRVMNEVHLVLILGPALWDLDLVLLEGPWSSIVKQPGDSEADHISKKYCLDYCSGILYNHFACFLTFSVLRLYYFCNQNQTSSFNKKKIIPAAALGYHKYFAKLPTYPKISCWILVSKKCTSGH